MYILIYALGLLIAYLTIGYLLHYLVFPESIPDFSHYFKPGVEFYSEKEGFRQIVEKHENGKVHCHLEVDPFAPGPPKHIHLTFDEELKLEKGELRVWMEGKIYTVTSENALVIPRGKAHRIYNDSNEKAIVNGTFAFPEKFAFGLSQVYLQMDNNPKFNRMPGLVLQISLLQANGLDSYLADGPPVFVQKLLSFLLIPIARLAGYRSYYPPDLSDKKTKPKLT